MTIGIYKIENLKNGKVYIGQSLNVEFRMKRHRRDLRLNNHVNTYLQNSWNKYGSENFRFSTLEKCPENILDERETFWINYYGGINSEQNFNLGKVNGGHVSDVVKEKIKSSNTGKKRTGTALNNIRQGVKNAKEQGKYFHKQSEETKQKISSKLKGRKLSEETKMKMSSAKKGKSLGKQTPEHIEKKRLASLGKKRSEEFRAQCRERAKKQFKDGKVSPNFNGASRKGYEPSAETKEKLRLKSLEYWKKVKSGEIVRKQKGD